MYAPGKYFTCIISFHALQPIEVDTIMNLILLMRSSNLIQKI